MEREEWAFSEWKALVFSQPRCISSYHHQGAQILAQRLRRPTKTETNEYFHAAKYPAEFTLTADGSALRL